MYTFFILLIQQQNQKQFIFFYRQTAKILNLNHTVNIKKKKIINYEFHQNFWIIVVPAYFNREIRLGYWWLYLVFLPGRLKLLETLHIYDG